MASKNTNKVVTVECNANGRGGSRTSNWGRNCQICNKVLREGQRAILLGAKQVGSYASCNWYHMECLKKILKDEPEFLNGAVVQTEFEKKRQEILKGMGVVEKAMSVATREEPVVADDQAMMNPWLEERMRCIVREEVKYMIELFNPKEGRR